MKSRTLLCAALVCLSQAPLHARAADDDARIQELERRVKQLEAGQPAAPAPGPAMGHMGMGSMDGPLSGPGVPFHGFADVGGGFQQHGQSGFTTGSFDIYLAPQFSDRVRALAEVLVEFGPTGEPGIDLERLQLGYAFSDALTLWLGRFHSPFGYYNTAFHHGKLMQTSIEKPKFMNFEDDGGVMPSHTVGTWATGAFRLGGSKFTYDVYVGNSPSIKDGALDMNNLASQNHTASRGLNIAYQGLDGNLRLGGHYYRAGVIDNAVPANDTKLSFIGPYAVFDNSVWEVIYEYYRWNNENLVSNTAAPTGEQHRSTAWFAQAGRRFGQWMPYARYEKTSFNQDDNFFTALEGGRSYTRKLAGVRYDINPRAAFTVEVFNTEQDDPVVPKYNELRFQYAIGF
jgi:hypothetical protein